MKLTERQHLLLRASAAGAGGLKGSGWWRTARTLVKLELGEIAGSRFVIWPEGLAASEAAERGG